MESDTHCSCSNVRKMFSVPEITAFCMLWSTPLLFLPTSFLGSTSKSRHHPPNTSIMIISFHFISLVLLLQYQARRTAFHDFLLLLFLPICDPRATHRKRDDSLWHIIRASTLLTLTSWCSANRGASQNACSLFDSYPGFGCSGEYLGYPIDNR